MLAEIQSAVADSLLDPEVPAPPAVTWGKPSSRRFDVYRNNVVAGLVDVLKTIFPITCRFVGDDYFHALARAYVQTHPPRSPVLLTYGHAFGDFVEHLPSAERVPYLGDLARLEWARINALNAADVEPARIEALASVPQTHLGGVLLAVHPAVTLIRSRWPVASLWRAGQEPGGDVPVDMRKAEDVVVTRPAFAVNASALPAGGGAFVEAISQGHAFDAAAERAVGDGGTCDLPGLLRLIFDLGAITAIHPSRTGSES